MQHGYITTQTTDTRLARGSEKDGKEKKRNGREPLKKKREGCPRTRAGHAVCVAPHPLHDCRSTALTPPVMCSRLLPSPLGDSTGPPSMALRSSLLSPYREQSLDLCARRSCFCFILLPWSKSLCTCGAASRVRFMLFVYSGCMSLHGFLLFGGRKARE